MAEQVVELAPAESKVVSFEATPHEAKTYQVTVDGLSGSFVASKPPTAKFEYVSDLRRRYTPELVYIEVDVKNTGDAAGLCTVYAYSRMEWRDGIPPGTYSEWSGPAYYEGPESQSATIEPGETVTFWSSFYNSPYIWEYKFSGSPGTIYG